MSKTTDAPQAMTLTLAEKEHRPIDVIEGELAAAKATVKQLTDVCYKQWEARERAITRRIRAEIAWKANPVTASEPFDEAAVGVSLAIPPEGTDESRRLHREHLRVDSLIAELEAARKAVLSGAASL